MLHSVLLIIHFFCAAGIIALVLLQRGKGAEAGAGFGAGASGTVFGARGATTALSRATAILAALFMVTSLSLAYVGAHKNAPSGSSILEQLSQPQPATSSSSGAAPAVPAAPGANAPPSAATDSPAAAPASSTPSSPAPAGGTAAPSGTTPSGTTPAKP
jgi:preprotein translocase subunit SecG